MQQWPVGLADGETVPLYEETIYPSQYQGEINLKKWKKRNTCNLLFSLDCKEDLAKKTFVCVCSWGSKKHLLVMVQTIIVFLTPAADGCFLAPGVWWTAIVGVDEYKWTIFTIRLLATRQQNKRLERETILSLRMTLLLWSVSLFSFLKGRSCSSSVASYFHH